jgi:hypothetical protein
VDVGGDPDDVADAVVLDEAEEARQLQLPAERRAGITVRPGLVRALGDVGVEVGTTMRRS